MGREELMKWKEENEGMIAVADAVSRGEIGHNNPPDPIDEALAPYGDSITEAEGWLDGATVENEGQMQAVDALLKEIKAAEKALNAARDSEVKPLHDVYKAAMERYKPTQADLDRIKRGLIAAVDGFKRRLAAQKAEAERKAREEAEAKARAAHEAAMKAQATDLDAQRAAAAAQAEAEEAARIAARASKDNAVKGMVTRTLYKVTDHKALLHWIAKNDRDAITAFVDEYARRNHSLGMKRDGLDVWQEKVAK